MLLPWGIIIVLVIAIIFMPKHLTLKEIFIIFVTAGYLAWSAHVLIGLMLNLYDLGPTGGVGLTDWVIVTLVPSCFAVLYLNLRKSGHYWLHVIIWSALSLLGELALVQSGYMKYKGWTLWYSIPVYLVAYSALPWYLNEVIRKLNCNK